MEGGGWKTEINKRQSIETERRLEAVRGNLICRLQTYIWFVITSKLIRPDKGMHNKSRDTRIFYNRSTVSTLHLGTREVFQT